MQKFVMYLGAALLLVAPAFAQAADTATTGKMPRSEQHFFTKAAEDGKAEIQIAQLAADHASSDAVKRFGQQMVTDHTKANDELMKLAQSKGITPPDKIDRKDQRAYDKLSKLSGAEFDKAFMKAMVKDHQRDVKMFQRAADKSKDPDVKNWAAQTLPKLQDHLQMAQQVAQETGAKSSKLSRMKGGSASPSASPSTSGSSSGSKY